MPEDTISTTAPSAGAPPEPVAGKAKAGTTWGPEQVEALLALWNEGLSASAIGRRLGVSKNAVLGKVHRLGLASRSPRPTEKPAARRAGAVALATLDSGMCRWPLDAPEAAEVGFCGAPTAEGKPYCASHCELAYVKPTKVREPWWPEAGIPPGDPDDAGPSVGGRSSGFRLPPWRPGAANAAGAQAKRVGRTGG